MKPRALFLALVTGALLVSCDWQMPETVTVKGSPEVYIPSGATVFELDFLDDIAADFGEAMAAGLRFQPRGDGVHLHHGIHPGSD